MSLSKTVLIILIGWALVNGFLLAHRGIVTTDEAAKYIRQANYFLANGHFRSSNFQYYSAIILLLALSIKLHCGLIPVVIIQLLVSLAATLCFFYTARKIFRSDRVALLPVILLLLNIPYQSFNTALQSESLFHSLSLLVSCYLIQHSRPRTQHLIYAFIFVAILSLSRPLGILYIPAVCIYFYFTTLRSGSLLSRLAFLGAVTLAFLYVLDRAMGSGGEFDFMLPFQEEHIICGTPTLLHPLNFPVAGNGNSVHALFYYISNHPGQFFRLAWLKTLSFWGVYRPWYSTRHNIILLCFFYPIILMAILSLRHWGRNYPNQLIYLLTVILMTWSTVILTCDDWSNRIFLSISPYLILLAIPCFKFIFPFQERPLEPPIAGLRHSKHQHKGHYQV